MFEDTLHKFLLVAGLFAAFVILSNFLALKQYSGRGKSYVQRRRRRRSSVSGTFEERDFSVGSESESDAENSDPDSEIDSRLCPSSDTDETMLHEKRKMLYHVIISAVGLIAAFLAVFVMWRIARGEG